VQAWPLDLRADSVLVSRPHTHSDLVWRFSQGQVVELSEVLAQQKEEGKAMNAEELKKQRVKLGHTQSSLAALLGLSTRQIIRYEMGKAPIPEIVRLALRSVPSVRSARREKGKLS